MEKNLTINWSFEETDHSATVNLTQAQLDKCILVGFVIEDEDKDGNITMVLPAAKS